MGMEHRITPAPGAPITWDAIAALLTGCKYPVDVRMIDGELAFPGEQPPADWREVRVGTPAGMITLRREPDALAVVTWGNADAALHQAWNTLAWACAEATGGRVAVEGGLVSAAEFRRRAALPEPPPAE